VRVYITGAAFGLAISFGGCAFAGQVPIDFGSAEGFAVLAGSTVTNTGASEIDGNLGVWPGTAVTGFPPGTVVNGAIYDGDLVAMQAQSDALAAYTTAAGETGGLSLTGQDLGGLTLTPGVYDFSSSAQLTGMLTLNAENIQNAVFIFQIGSTLTTAAGSLISVINSEGADVVWQIGSSATLGAGSSFDGDILALTSITLDTGASISCGGALALNGAVTMNTNSVSTSGSSCGTGQMEVPEPRSLVLLVVGVLGLLGVGCRGKESV
jgi:type VI secretion system secreted protein VgrG